MTACWCDFEILGLYCGAGIVGDAVGGGKSKAVK